MPATTLARIVRLVEEARAGRYPFAPLVDRLVRVFVPLVLGLALATFAYWTLTAGTGAGADERAVRAPDRLPVRDRHRDAARLDGRGRAAPRRRASWCAHGETFERLARASRVFFDKTGTLTGGVPALVDVRPAPGVTERELLSLAAGLEAHSEHPLAASVSRRRRRRGASHLSPVSDFRALAGARRRGPPRGQRAAARARRTSSARRPSSRSRAPASSTCLAGRRLARRARLPGLGPARPRPRRSPSSARPGLAVEVLSGDQHAAVAAIVAGLPGVVASAELLPEAKLRAGRPGDPARRVAGHGRRRHQRRARALRRRGGRDPRVRDRSRARGGRRDDPRRRPPAAAVADRPRAPHAAHRALQPLLGLLLQRDRPHPRGAGPPAPALRRRGHGRVQPPRRPPLAEADAPPAARGERPPLASPKETPDDPQWLVAAGLTLAGSIHCVGMCGGFVLAVAAGRRGAWRLAGHQVQLQLGKAVSYAFLGALAGAFGSADPREPRLHLGRARAGRRRRARPGRGRPEPARAARLRGVEGRRLARARLVEGRRGRSSPRGPPAFRSSWAWRWASCRARSSTPASRRPRRAAAPPPGRRSWPASPSGTIPALAIVAASGTAFSLGMRRTLARVAGVVLLAAAAVTLTRASGLHAGHGAHAGHMAPAVTPRRAARPTLPRPRPTRTRTTTERPG